MKFAHVFLHETAEFCAFRANNFLKLLIMPSKSSKRKRIPLMVTRKLELIRKLKKGASVTSVCEKYGVVKQTVFDIRKSKDKKLYILLRTVISFDLHYINAFVLSGLFHYPDWLRHHLFQKNEGRVQCKYEAPKKKILYFFS